MGIQLQISTTVENATDVIFSSLFASTSFGFLVGKKNSTDIQSSESWDIGSSYRQYFYGSANDVCCIRNVDCMCSYLATCLPMCT